MLENTQPGLLSVLGAVRSWDQLFKFAPVCHEISSSAKCSEALRRSSQKANPGSPTKSHVVVTGISAASIRDCVRMTGYSSIIRLGKSSRQTGSYRVAA